MTLGETIEVLAIYPLKRFYIPKIPSFYITVKDNHVCLINISSGLTYRYIIAKSHLDHDWKEYK